MRDKSDCNSGILEYWNLYPITEDFCHYDEPAAEHHRIISKNISTVFFYF